MTFEVKIVDLFITIKSPINLPDLSQYQVKVKGLFFISLTAYRLWILCQNVKGSKTKIKKFKIK